MGNRLPARTGGKRYRGFTGVLTPEFNGCGAAAPRALAGPGQAVHGSGLPHHGNCPMTTCMLQGMARVWWRSLAVDGGSGTFRGHARNA